MLTRNVEAVVRFTRRDASRLFAASAVLVVVLTLILGVLAREVKTRRESVDAFRKGGREDLAGKEEAEIAILQEYLPQALSEEEIRSLVDEAITSTGATSARDMGKVMGWLAPRTRGRADGKHVSELVAQGLARTDLAGHDRATG